MRSVLAGANRTSSIGSGRKADHGGPSHLRDQLQERLSALCRQGGEEGTDQGRGGCVISWLTGYSAEGLAAVLEEAADFETFFARAPKLNPARTLITGTVCGVR